MLLRRVPGLENLRYSDREIEAMLARSVRAMRRRRNENGQARTGTETGVRFAVNADIQAELDRPLTPDEKRAVNRFLDGEPIAEMKEHEVPHFEKMGALVRYINEYYAQHGARTVSSSLGFEISLEGKAVSSSVAHGIHPAKVQAFLLVPDIIRKGMFAGKLEKNNANDPNAYLIVAPVRIGTERYIGLVEFIVDPNINRMKLHDAILQKNSSASGYASVPKNNPARRGAVRKLLEDIRSLKYNINDSGEKSSTSDGDGLHFSIAPVWTGSAADYDRPSLHYIGTGEGAQAYGWGLYGSSSEKIARWYAKTDVERKNRARILLDGKEPDPDWLDRADLSGEPTEFEIENNVLEDVRGRKGSISGTLEYYRLQMNKPATRRENPEFYRLCREWLEKNKDRIQYIPEQEDTAGRRNLYRQTFWPGKEENLLDWDSPVAEEQQNKITEQLKKEGLFLDGDPDQASADYRELKLKQKSGEEVSQEELDAAYNKAARLHAQRNVIGKTVNGDIPSGSMVYENLEEILGSPQAVSEFLYRAGIDGITYIGKASEVRNYVAFSDQDIHVDDHLRFSVSEYSDQDMETFATILRPFVGLEMEKSDAECLAYLQEKGLPIHTEEWAHGK